MRRASALGGVARGRELVAAPAELVDRGLHPLACAREQADLLEHDEGRDSERAEARTRASGCRPGSAAPVDPSPPRAGRARRLRRPPRRAGAERGRLGDALDGLLGVARERHGEHQRALADEAGQLVALRDHDRHRHERAGDDRQDVAGDAAAAHAQHHHVARRVALGQPVDARSKARPPVGHLLGERGRADVPHPERVEHHEANVGLEALGGGLGHQPLVLGVVDGLGLVDQHDRDVVADRVAALEARVVEGRPRRRSRERALVLGAGEDLEQLRIERHGQQCVSRL